MANVLGTLFGDIAAAIREKTGETGTMKPAEFPDKIAAIVGESTVVGGVDPYYQKLAEALMIRNPEFLTGDKRIMSMKNFVSSDGNTLASLNPHSFAGFNSVEGMEFTDVVYIQTDAFAGDTKLKIIDITAPAVDQLNQVVFVEGSLNGCTALESIIIRDGGVGVAGANVSANHGGSDTFYVYVPASCYDTIIAAISGNTIPASRYRKLEDYPDIDNWISTE